MGKLKGKGRGYLWQVCHRTCAFGRLVASRGYPEELHDDVVGCTWRAGQLILEMSQLGQGKFAVCPEDARSCGRTDGFAGLGQSQQQQAMMCFFPTNEEKALRALAGRPGR